MRFFGLLFLIEAIVIVTELPTVIYGVVQTHLHYLSIQQELLVGTLLFRLLVYLGTAIAFLFFSRPLARLFTRDLDEHD